MEDKVLCTNRQAAHQYFLLERYETGMALTGTEVKSVRNGKANLKDAYVSSGPNTTLFGPAVAVPEVNTSIKAPVFPS